MNHLIEKSMTGLIFASVPLLTVVACTSEDKHLTQQEPQIQGMQEQIQAVRDRLSEPTDTSTARVHEHDEEGAAREEGAHATMAGGPDAQVTPMDHTSHATMEVSETSAPMATGDSTTPTPLRVFHYGFDQKELTEQDRDAIKQYAAQLLQNPTSVLHIRGHADSQGPKSYNQRLSEQRAQKVGELLIAEGVPATQLRISGLGDRLPATDAKTYKQNRRVELSYGDTQVAAAP